MVKAVTEHAKALSTLGASKGGKATITTACLRIAFVSADASKALVASSLWDRCA